MDSLDYPGFVELLAEELLLDPRELQPDAPVWTGLGVHPMDLMHLAERLEARGGPSLQGVDLQSVHTVEELYWQMVMGGRHGGDSVVGSQASRARTTPAEPHEVALRQHLPQDIHTDVTTISGALSRRAAVTPDREALTFAHSALTYRQLARQAAGVAAALQRHGIGHGDRVVLVHDHGPGFFSAFWGALQVRAVAVPLSGVPRPERIALVARHTDAVAIITARPLARPIQRRLEAGLGDALPALLTVEELHAERVDTTRPLAASEPGDLALIQFTSGTTDDPRGVMLTQAALLANVRQMIPPAKLSADDVFVSWLPVWHDLGLIAMTMCPLYLGARLVLLPARLAPHNWLSAIAQYRATVTAAPDFAYRYALRFGGPLDRFDLSSLRLALVAGEPVRRSTIDRFEEALGLPGVLRPGYGLAEAAVGVSLLELEERVSTDEHGHVCVGRPLPGVDVEVRGPDGLELEREVCGPVWVRSPAQTVGYFRNPEQTAALFSHDGWVRTGDLGWMDVEGRLTIVGREKDLIITAGRPVPPSEVEEAAESLDAVFWSMAIGLDVGGEIGEQVHLFVETAIVTGTRRQKLALMQQVRGRVHEWLELRTTRVHLVPPDSLPRTSTGKRARNLLRKSILGD